MALTKVNAKTATTNTGMVLLNSTTVSSAVANVTFNSTLITDSYDDYVFIGRYLKPATDSQPFAMYLSIDNGSNYNLTVQHSMLYEDLSTDASGRATGFGQDNTSSTIKMSGSLGNDSGGGAAFHIRLFGLSNTSYYKHGNYDLIGTHANAEGNNYHWSGGIRILTASAINNVKFLYDSGNIADGKISLYGVNL